MSAPFETPRRPVRRPGGTEARNPSQARNAADVHYLDRPFLPAPTVPDLPIRY